MSETGSGPWSSFLQSLSRIVEKIWKAIVPSTNIDDYPVDEGRVGAISLRVPETVFGRELMTNAWPKLYESGYSSETYLGCVAALLALNAHIRKGMSRNEIEQKIIAIDESLKNSKVFMPGAHRTGGAAITMTNAWERTRLGYSAEQIANSFDSELIYASKMFLAAREREKAGETLR